MGKPDDRRTVELDPKKLAELTQGSSDSPNATRPVTDKGQQMRVPRTKTLDDPMTTGLLAEVARRSQTVEFDSEVIETLLDQIDDAQSGDQTEQKSHPRVVRRPA